MSYEIGSGGPVHAGQLKDPVTGEWRDVVVGELLECIEHGLYSISYGSMHEFAGYLSSGPALGRIKGHEGPYWLSGFKIAAAQNCPTAIATSGATVRTLEFRPEDLQGETVCVQDAPPSDAVFRPSHYARWNIEPITFISANNLDFLTGNVIKYVMRHDAKNGLEDLRKAARYLEILIGHVEREKAGTSIKVEAV